MSGTFLAQRVPMSEYPAAMLQSQNNALDGLGDRLDRAVLDVTAKMKELQAGAAEQTRRAEAMERQAADLERQLAIAEAKLAVEMMHSAGLAAQASHMMAVAIEADVPALSELAEERNVGGTLKSRLAEVYEAAFDAKAAELGIEEPARFREA
jgi:hypothetical protein